MLLHADSKMPLTLNLHIKLCFKCQLIGRKTNAMFTMFNIFFTWIFHDLFLFQAPNAFETRQSKNQDHLRLQKIFVSKWQQNGRIPQIMLMLSLFKGKQQTFHRNLMQKQIYNSSAALICLVLALLQTFRIQQIASHQDKSNFFLS